MPIFHIFFKFTPYNLPMFETNTRHRKRKDLKGRNPTLPKIKACPYQNSVCVYIILSYTPEPGIIRPSCFLPNNGLVTATEPISCMSLIQAYLQLGPCSCIKIDKLQQGRRKKKEKKKRVHG